KRPSRTRSSIGWSSSWLPVAQSLEAAVDGSQPVQEQVGFDQVHLLKLRADERGQAARGDHPGLLAQLGPDPAGDLLHLSHGAEVDARLDGFGGALADDPLGPA